MNIENKLSASVMEAIKALYGQDVPEKMVQLQKTRAEFEGNLTLVVFPFLKLSSILKDFYYNFARFEKMGIVGSNGTGNRRMAESKYR